MHAKWSKYSALNIIPLARLGTIEFRHMHGTKDQVLMKDWLGSISNLFKLGQRLIIAEDVLTEKGIQSCYEEVFAGTAVLARFPKVTPLVENSVIDVKMGLL